MKIFMFLVYLYFIKVNWFYSLTLVRLGSPETE